MVYRAGLFAAESDKADSGDCSLKILVENPDGMKAIDVEQINPLGNSYLQNFTRVKGNRDLGGHSDWAKKAYWSPILSQLGLSWDDIATTTKSGGGIQVQLGNSETYYTFKNNGLYDKEGKKYSGDDPFLNNTLNSLIKIYKSGESGKLFLSILSGKNGVIIKDLKFRFEIIDPDVPFYDPQLNTVYMDYNYKGKYMTTAGYTTRSPFLILAHELGHAYSYNMGFYDNSKWASPISGGDDIVKDEWFASYIENRIAFDSYEPLRTHYDEYKGKPNEETKLIDNYQIGTLKILFISIPYIKNWSPTTNPSTLPGHW